MGDHLHITFSSIPGLYTLDTSSISTTVVTTKMSLDIANFPSRGRSTATGAVMTEWLRRWTQNPLGSPHAGSNPAHSIPVHIVIAKVTQLYP